MKAELSRKFKEIAAAAASSAELLMMINIHRENIIHVDI